MSGITVKRKTNFAKLAYARQSMLKYMGACKLKHCTSITGYVRFNIESPEYKFRRFFLFIFLHEMVLIYKKISSKLCYYIFTITARIFNIIIFQSNSILKVLGTSLENPEIVSSQLVKY